SAECNCGHTSTPSPETCRLPPDRCAPGFYGCQPVEFLPPPALQSRTKNITFAGKLSHKSVRCEEGCSGHSGSPSMYRYSPSRVTVASCVRDKEWQLRRRTRPPAETVQDDLPQSRAGERRHVLIDAPPGRTGSLLPIRRDPNPRFAHE